METLKKVMQHNLPELTDVCNAKPKIMSLASAKTKEALVVDCFPTGRLVCMFDESAGILEDHRRELAYFEKTDLNLPSGLEMKDVVMVMTRCRDVTIRFQASQVLSGPVKMIAHNGTVVISSNLERYFPEISVKKALISMKPNSFDLNKIIRAKTAVELYKEDKILTPDYIIDSGEFSSTLVKPKRYSSSSSSAHTNAVSLKKQLKSVAVPSSKEVRTAVKQTGKVKNILNDNFGLLEFCRDDLPTFCLFDTFDLYLEGGKTAAQGELTVANVLALDMEVCFHACEISPGSSVPWLANGVWRPDISSQPKPVPHSKITKEKLAVFKKVSESCEVLLSGVLVAASGSGQQSEEASRSTGTEASDMKGTIETQVVGDGDEEEEKTQETKLHHEDSMNLNDTENVAVDVIKEQIEVNSVRVSKVCQKTNEDLISAKANPRLRTIEMEEVNAIEYARIYGYDVKPVVTELKKEDNQIVKTEETGNLEVEKEAEVENNFVLNDNVDTIEVECVVKEEAIEKGGLESDTSKDQVTSLIEVDAGGTSVGNKIEESLNKDTTKTCLNSDDVSLPELLIDQHTCGTLDRELSLKLAILSLSSPAGAKALLHSDRMWVTDHPMFGGFGWEVLTWPAEQGIRVNARRVTGFEEFDYQVTFAHAGVSTFNVEMGDYSYTTELARFAEDKQEVAMLDSQLELFYSKEK
eukprot:GFUD01034134.1.p1 GENE.GFUD01034134.1~~GFUD01034134.1.p1  ORF type:complete len:720 (+),score=233.20 GFUD01034134.1:76-2160(+)